MGRRRRSRGGTSRRRFLAGGLLGLGGVSILGGTQAFSRTDATRGASVQTAGDENALLGVAPVGSVQTGTDDQDLVALTNNTDATLDVTVALDDPSQGSVAPSTATIASGASTTVAVSVASDSPTGTDALSFSVTATDGADFTVSLTRAVDVVAGPALVRHVTDQSANGNVEYRVQYRVENVPSFDHVEASFVSQDQGWASGSDSSTASEGILAYSQGGAMGDTYEITIDVYDGSGEVVLQEVVTDVADDENPPDNDDLGGPDDSTLESFTLTDSTDRNHVVFSLEYTVSATDSFQHVRVTVDNRSDDWSDQSTTHTDEPTGTVSYDSWTGQDTFDVTVEVVNGNGITVDDGTIVHEAGSSGSRSWPP